MMLAALAVAVAMPPALGADPAASFALIRAEMIIGSSSAGRTTSFGRIRDRMLAENLGSDRAASFGRIRQRMIADSIGEVMQQSAKSVEIVTFHDRPSVTVVRGPGRRAAPALIPMTADKLEIVSFANPQQSPVTVIRGAGSGGAGAVSPWEELFAPASGAELDLVAFAVDGAESSHGADLGMWRPEWSGPQGPMQVSEAAALDVGGGDRFDIRQNRLLGRAYLAHLYRRYGNWPDAVTAYNWGPGNLDTWIAGGRPADDLPLEVERYRDRVLRESGLRHSLDLRLAPVLPMR